MFKNQKMEAVKTDLLQMSKTLEESRDLPLTPENFDRAESDMRLAIDSCKYYLDNNL